MLGELLSLHPSSTYYFEPFRQHKLSCFERDNSSSIANLIERTIVGLHECDSKLMDNKFVSTFGGKNSYKQNSLRCKETSIRVIKGQFWIRWSGTWKLKFLFSCEILVSCSDKERNCIQAHRTVFKLMELHASLCNCMQAYVTACKLM